MMGGGGLSPEGQSLRRGRGPFTLIEVMAVAVIMALLLSVTFVKLDSMIPTARLKKHVRMVAGAIELAQTQAAVEGKDIALRLDKDSRSIRMEIFVSEEDEAEGARLEKEWTRLPEKAEEEAGPLYEAPWEGAITLEELEVSAFDKEDSREFIIFSPFGYSDGVRMVWKEKGGATQEMELWPMLGKIVIGPVKFGF